MASSRYFRVRAPSSCGGVCAPKSALMQPSTSWGAGLPATMSFMLEQSRISRSRADAIFASLSLGTSPPTADANGAGATPSSTPPTDSAMCRGQCCPTKQSGLASLTCAHGRSLRSMLECRSTQFVTFVLGSSVPTPRGVQNVGERGSITPVPRSPARSALRRPVNAPSPPSDASQLRSTCPSLPQMLGALYHGVKPRLTPITWVRCALNRASCDLTLLQARCCWCPFA